MGMRLFGRCSVYPNDEINKKKRCTVVINAAAPDPINFEIMETLQVGRHVVARIHYPDCNNYEGEKICLFLYATVPTVKNWTTIDPHFSEDPNSPFARFKPNDMGWKMAIELAKAM